MVALAPCWRANPRLHLPTLPVAQVVVMLELPAGLGILRAVIRAVTQQMEQSVVGQPRPDGRLSLLGRPQIAHVDVGAFRASQDLPPPLGGQHEQPDPPSVG